MGRKRKPGRRKGSRTRGYFYRTHRGWYISAPGEPKLCDLAGNHLRFPDEKKAAAEAYTEYRRARKTLADDKGGSITVADACQRFLAHAQRHLNAIIFEMRRGFLFDFCSGFPARWWDKLAEAPASARLHIGYGARRAVDITPADIDVWVAAHPGWKSNRLPVQAVRRTFNYCVNELKRLSQNPIRGVRMDQVGRRETYFTPEVEEAIYRYAKRDLAQVIRFGIMAGTRPNCEYARVEARHVEITARGNMLWHFPAKEAKVKSKDRYIFIPRSLKPIVEGALCTNQGGPLFRDWRGKPWKYRQMESRFRRLRAKLMKKGVPIEKGDVIYTARHTFAKRQLGGYWTGEPVSIEILAGLMGNTPAVCWKHYAQWCSKYMEPLRNAVNY